MFIPGNESQPETPPVAVEPGPITMPPDSPPPPTKASLKTWWNHFNFAQKAKKEAEGNKGTSATL
jgi:hypothetical protein